MYDFCRAYSDSRSIRFDSLMHVVWKKKQNGGNYSFLVEKRQPLPPDDGLLSTATARSVYDEFLHVSYTC